MSVSDSENVENHRVCASQTNMEEPKNGVKWTSKISEHKDANENQWEEKTTPHEMQMKTNENKKQQHVNPTTWNRWRQQDSVKEKEV